MNIAVGLRTRRWVTGAVLFPILLFMAFLAFGSISDLITSASTYDPLYENNIQVNATSSVDSVTVHVEFNQYKPSFCTYGILVIAGNDSIPFSTMNEVYENDVCIETDVVFDNIIYITEDVGGITGGSVLNETSESGTSEDDLSVNITETNESVSNITETNETGANETATNITETNTTQINETLANETENSTQTNGTQTNITETNTTEINETSTNEMAVNETGVNETLVNDTQTNETTLEINSIVYTIYYGKVEVQTDEETNETQTNITETNGSVTNVTDLNVTNISANITNATENVTVQALTYNDSCVKEIESYQGNQTFKADCGRNKVFFEEKLGAGEGVGYEVNGKEAVWQLKGIKLSSPAKEDVVSVIHAGVNETSNVNATGLLLTGGVVAELPVEVATQIAEEVIEELDIDIDDDFEVEPPSEYSLEENNSLSYDEVFEGIDVFYSYKLNKLKEEIIIEDKANVPTSDEDPETLDFIFTLEYDEELDIIVNDEVFTLGTVQTHKRILFVDSSETLYYFEKPFAYDANGEKTGAIYNLKKTEDKTLLSIQVPYDWLIDSDREYPVAVDPTMSSAVYNLTEVVALGGGSTTSSNPDYNISYNIGEPVIGRTSLTGAYIVDLGYYYGSFDLSGPEITNLDLGIIESLGETGIVQISFDVVDSLGIDSCTYSLSGANDLDPTEIDLNFESEQSASGIDVVTLNAGSTTLTVSCLDTSGNTGESSISEILTFTYEPLITSKGAGSPSQSSSFNSVASGTKKTFSVDQPGLSVTEVSFITSENIDSAYFEVIGLDSQPQTTSSLLSIDRVSEFIEIKSNVDPNSLSSVEIIFDVTKVWIEKMDIIEGTIALKRFANGEWTELPTSLVSESNGILTFKAISPGFSYFAVSGKTRPMSDVVLALPDGFSIDVIAGKTVTKELMIYNYYKHKISISIVLENLENIVVVDKHIEVEGDKQGSLPFTLTTYSDNIRIGKIILEDAVYGGIIAEVPVIVNVKAGEILFDVSISMPEQYKTVAIGEDVTAQINLLQIGPDEGVDVKAEYTIKELSGNTIFRESETFFVQKEKSYVKKFDVPTLHPTSYLLGLEIIYPGGFATSSTQFEVTTEEEQIRNDYSPAAYFFRARSSIFGWVALILVLLLVFIAPKLLNMYKKKAQFNRDLDDRVDRISREWENKRRKLE